MATGLTRQYYTRGGQGTFVYAPDIAVFIQTQENGIIDLSPHIVEFDVNRVINDVSTFNCVFDNKYAIYDRRIRRMDRIVVFLKRISWMQVFSGYIVEAPWQTVVPGNASLKAECTLKRLKHSYFDPHSMDSNELFPFMNIETDWEATDGGAAQTIVRLLENVAMWDTSQVQIQKIPINWIKRAIKLARKLAKASVEEENTAEFQSILAAFNNLVDASGWQGYFKGGRDWISETGKRIPGVAGAGVGDYSDAQWKDYSGQTDIDMYPAHSGNVALTGGYIETQHPEQLFSVKVNGTVVTQKFSAETGGNTLYLRLDAADQIAKLLKDFKDSTGRTWDIDFGYLSFDDAVKRWDNFAGKAPSDWEKTSVSESVADDYLMKGNTSGIIAPVNDSDFVWGTAFKVKENGNLYNWLNFNPINHTKYGFHRIYDPKVVAQATEEQKELYAKEKVASRAFVFRGSPKYWDATGRPDQQGEEWDSIDTAADKNLAGTGGPTDTFSDASVFSVMFYYPGLDFESDILTGSRAWINDVPVLDYIKQVCAASQRDFMSAPNGDFVAFFPDRLGQYANFPTLRVRDIEVVDFRAVVSDEALTTHYISYGDFEFPTGGTGHNNVADTFFTGGMLTVQQPDVLKFLLGVDDDDAADLGSQMMNLFGIRPRTEQAYYIRNRGYNFAVALHKFQEFWANQWKYYADFTFLPEIFPGMRIELVDREPNPLSVYVESVSHSGNRTSGFKTSVTFSTPTVFQDGRWTLLRPEIAPDSPLLPQTERVREELAQQAAEEAAWQQAWDNQVGGRGVT